MSNIGNTLKVLSINWQGLRDKKKRDRRFKLLQGIRCRNNIICLQDTHLTENDLPLTEIIWNNDCYLHGKQEESARERALCQLTECF